MNICAPKHNERLLNVINMLKNQLEARDNALETDISPDSDNNSTEEMQTSDRKDLTEKLYLPGNERSPDWRSQEDRSLRKSYLMFDNNSNLCWLDSSMSLLCHNKTLSNFVNDSSSQIANIMKSYESAISIINDYSNESTIEEKLQKPKAILQKVQETVLRYLKPILNFKEGEPDSAFCCLLNLIGEDEQIKNLFLVEFSWIRNCTKCAIPRIRDNKKTIITLSKVVTFNPSSPVSLCKCPVCECKDQEVVIKYKTLPQCLIFHFENGAGEGELDSIDFEVNDRKYKLSGLIKIERSHDLTVSHFVTWIRDIATDSWLECNDLKSEILSFSVVPPVINLKDIYIAMYEALDDKGTISNISEEIDSTLKMDTDDTNSSDIPLIDLSDEEESIETKQDKVASNTVLLEGLFKTDKTDYDSHEKVAKQFDNIISDNVFRAKSTLESPQNDAVSKKDEIKQDKRTSNMVFLGGLFKPDKTDYDSQEEMSKRLDEILSDNDFSAKSIQETSENNAKKEKLSAENSEIQNLDLQDNSTFTSSVKTDAPLVMDELSKSARSNSQNNSKNCPKNSVTDSIKQSPIKDSKANDFENQDNNKSSSSLRKSPNKNSKLDVSVLAETKNISLKRCNSPSKNPSTPFENLDSKIVGCSSQSPVEPQNSKLDRNISVETNCLNLVSPIDAAGDCTQDAVESCARTSGMPTSRKESKKKIARDNLVFKKRATIKNEQFTEDAAVDHGDNEKTVETSTLLDLTLHTSAPQKQLQESCIDLSSLPENLSAVTVKKTNDKQVVESESVDALEAKTQDINPKLSLKPHILGRKASEDTSKEISSKIESAASKQSHISDNLKTTLNPKIEKSAVKLSENNVCSKTNVVDKQAENSSKEVCVDDVKNLIDSTIKLHKVNAKSLKSDDPKESENKNINSPTHLTIIPNNRAEKQPKDIFLSSIKPNDQLNVQSLKSEEINENISLRNTVEFEQKDTIISPNELEVKNLPSKTLFVQLTKLKDCEIANYVEGNLNLKETKQIKSLEELTKTIVVKVEKTDSKSILKRTVEQAGPSKVQSIEPIRNSSRIFARKMRKATETEKAKESLLETVSKRKNSQELLENNTAHSTVKRRRQILESSPKVTEKTLKTKDLPERAYRTRSATNVPSDVSSGIHSQSNTKKKSNADEGVKSKRRRTKSIEKGNSDTQSSLHTQHLLEGTSSSQVVHDEPDVLRVLGPSLSGNSLVSTNKNYPISDNEIAVHTRDQIHVDVSRSSAVREHPARNLKDNFHSHGKNEECISDCECNGLQLHELLENCTNCTYDDIFKFFLSHKTDFNY